MCLTAHQEHPSLASCDPSDRYQLWSFIWGFPLYTQWLCMHWHTNQTLLYADNMQVFGFCFHRWTTMSFNLFLYIEELNICCWEVSQNRSVTAGRRLWSYVPRRTEIPKTMKIHCVKKCLFCVLDLLIANKLRLGQDKVNASHTKCRSWFI